MTAKQRLVGGVVFLAVATAVTVAGVLVGNQVQRLRSPQTGSPQMTATGIRQFTPDRTMLRQCELVDIDCVEQAFGNISYRHGPAMALQLLDKRIERSIPLRANCHRITHSVGAAMLARHGRVTAAAFVPDASMCNAGYFHGLLSESLDGAAHTPHGLGQRAVATCRQPALARVEFVRVHCMHFMGHAFIVWSGYDLFFAVHACEEFAAWDGNDSCFSGAFMENFVSVDGVTRSSWVRSDDLNYPCNIVASRYKFACYQSVGIRALEFTRGNWKEAESVCLAAELDWRDECVMSLGRSSAAGSGFAPRQTERTCAQSRRYYQACVLGAAEAFATNFPSGLPAGQLCAITRKTFRTACFRTASSVVLARVATRTSRLAACRRLTNMEYRHVCEQGIERILATQHRRHIATAIPGEG